MREKTIEKWQVGRRQCQITKCKPTLNDMFWFTGYVQTNLNARHQLLNNVIDIHGGLNYGVDEDGYVGFDFQSHNINDPVIEVERLARQLKNLELVVFQLCKQTR